jgi:tRNA (adenine37-N6)-methyltransferase
LSDEITFKPIGIVHSPYKEPKNVPIQAIASNGTEGTIEIYPQYTEGLRDIEGFSHLIVLFHLHLVTGSPLVVKPFLDDQMHGVFATRSPSRPNKIGFSVVQLIKKEGNILYIKDLDMIEGTPVIDIKPYIPEFDSIQYAKTGWFANKISKLETTRDDGRFCKGNAKVSGNMPL